MLTSKIERDFYLIEDADNGIIIWDGECRESYICMLYLISIGKKCRLYLMSEDKWIDIESIEELSNFAGDEGTIEREDVREVLERCGFSEQMIEYSVANDTVSPWTLADIICQAPIKLDEKLYCLSHLGRKRDLKYEVFNSVYDNMKKSVPYKRIKHDIRALVDYRGEESIWMYYWDLYHKIKAAKDEMYDFEDLIIDKLVYLFNEWYDTDELMIKSSPCGMFATIKQAIAYIKKEQKEDGTENVYYRIEVWNPYEGTREQPRYDYYVYKGEICWFEVLWLKFLGIY